MNTLLHTPEGVRDTFGKESAAKKSVINNISSVFDNFGYRNIDTPTLEFFDIFSEERGSVPSKDLFKLFDREGNTIVLKPDNTPSIARHVAKNYMDSKVPVKLSYNTNTFINNSELQGKLKEATQIGCELINDKSVDGDAEIIALVVESLKNSGLDNFLVDIGQVDFYKGLIEEAGLDDSTEEKLRTRIENKNVFGVEDLLNEYKVNEKVKQAFLDLPTLYGSIEILDKAKSVTNNEKSLKAIKRLEKLYALLEEYGVSAYVSFDLGMISNYTYYTGIIFKAYTHGLGDEIVAGGRYDNLIGQYGKKAPAVGFAIYVDRFIPILKSMDVDYSMYYDNTVIIFDSKSRKKAIEMASAKRANNERIELIHKSSKLTIDDYASFKKEEGAKSIIVIENNKEEIVF